MATERKRPVISDGLPSQLPDIDPELLLEVRGADVTQLELQDQLPPQSLLRRRGVRALRLEGSCRRR